MEWASSAICFSPIIPPHCLCVPLGRNPGEEMAGNHRQILELLGARNRQEKHNKKCKMPARSQLLPWGWSEEAGFPPWRLRHLKLIVSILCRHSTWNERNSIIQCSYGPPYKCEYTQTRTYVHARESKCYQHVIKGPGIFPCGSDGKESACNAGDLGSCNVGDLGLILGLGRSPGEGNKCPLQYSGLENPMDCRVHRVAKSQTWLSNFHSLHLGMLSHKQQKIKITSFLIIQHLYRLLCLLLFCIH